MSELFSPITLRDTVVRNRVWVAPMCQYSAVDGVPNDWHLVHLGSFATRWRGPGAHRGDRGRRPRGGSPRRTPASGTTSSSAPGPGSSFFLHAQGATVGMQLAHAGRKASTFAPWHRRAARCPRPTGGWQTVGPSAVPFPGYRDAARALRGGDRRGRRGVRGRSPPRAGRRLRRGRDPRRPRLPAPRVPLPADATPATDRYGGSFDNRVRLLLEVVEAVRDAVARRRTRCSSGSPRTDWVEGGWDADQSVRLAGLLKEAGVDLVDISTGGNVARRRSRSARATRCRSPRRVRARGRPPGRRGRPDHRAEAGRGDRRRRLGRRGAAGPRAAARPALAAARRPRARGAGRRRHRRHRPLARAVPPRHPGLTRSSRTPPAPSRCRGRPASHSASQCRVDH